LRAENIPPAADFIHGYAVIEMRRTRKDNAMAKNLLLECSDELGGTNERLLKYYKENIEKHQKLRYNKIREAVET